MKLIGLPVPMDNASPATCYVMVTGIVKMDQMRWSCVVSIDI